MTGGGLVLVHGLFDDRRASPTTGMEQACVQRAAALAEHGSVLGVRHYDWVDGRRKRVANRLLRAARGTAPAVDAVEIIEIDEEMLRAALADRSSRSCLQELAGCASYGLDPARSFVVMGTPRRLLDGPTTGRRVLWFGHGAGHLSESEFIAHYTGHHGPMFAGHAPLVGVHRYEQVPNEQSAMCDSLRELGLGHATPPAVFAELYAGRPPVDPRRLRAQRSALAEIRIDEKRHIDFGRSMLLLA